MIEDMTSQSSRRAVSDDVTGRLALQTATLLLPLEKFMVQRLSLLLGKVLNRGTLIVQE
jgi:hypothetical protein